MTDDVKALNQPLTITLKPSFSTPDSESELLTMVMDYSGTLATEVVNLKEKAVRNALIDLGWTPPEAHPTAPSEPVGTGEALEAVKEIEICFDQFCKTTGRKWSDRSRRNFETIKATLTRPKVDAEALKKRAYEHFENKYDDMNLMDVHGDTMLEDVIDYFASQGYLQAQVDDVPINVVSVTCPCGNTLQVNKALSLLTAQEGK